MARESESRPSRKPEDSGKSEKRAENRQPASVKKLVPSKGGLSIGPLEAIAIAVAIGVMLALYQKQNADALVAQCAQHHDRGEYEEALHLCTSALSIYLTLNDYSRQLGWKDGFFWTDVAQTTDNIGVVNMNLGDSESALHYHQTALLMREAKLGPHHLDVAATKDNLGLVYRQLNYTEKALELHTQALDIRLQTVGPYDVATAASKTAIANVYYQREDFGKALELYNEVLETQMETLGHDHLDVAATLQNIATVLKHSDLDQSWDKFETSLGIIVGIYGHNHRSVADTLNNMGGVLFAQDKFDAAMSTYQESLEIGMSILGPGHPDVAATLSNIGAVLEKQGKKEEAEEKFAQAAAIWQEAGIEWQDELDGPRAEL
mmetsp:Transcript_41266/g.82623  ORF Transcript_41266/g.82623 Transcript_41266/m.82623 type:complete len:377 (+) Transcript_41266:119-1249(+)|eukprot:CAMPEP_0202816200 /NCGR_PEP_ID=MMETSP1389-20130828/6795_1 /ASSEMBLY_ACC=CAM_ASM_000865 /TAXON_ID=302021 /ORGANISM="Rhodomonas sp., Strain CCMP768" /LENGTH=376 /DNA_ID=CAMNT_0049488233 /DNA_START=41 /DNA_END=1171 /DNA_ORIENTATION=-